MRWPTSWRPGRRPRLAYRPGQQLGVRLGRLGRQDDLLDGHHAVQDPVMASPYPPHAALPDRLGQQVPSRDHHPRLTLHGRMIIEKDNKLPTGHNPYQAGRG
jgi:hypothetical protein